jgi:hypothetical protein
MEETEEDTERAEIPQIFEEKLEVREQPIKYVKSPPHDLLATNRHLMVSRRHKPIELTILSYKDINSVEHKRLINFKRLVIACTLFALFFAFLFVGEVEGIFEDTFDWFEDSLNLTVPIQPQDFVFWAGILFAILGMVALVTFFGSLPYRLVVYYTGKGSLDVPLQLDGDSMELLSVVHERVKGSSSLSKEEIEQIIGEKIGRLLEARAKLEQELLGTIKAKAVTAKTPEEKEGVRQLLEKSVTQLEKQDKVIEQELQKTGISREEVFRKYRIKEPKREFVDAILHDSQVSDLMGNLSK